MVPESPICLVTSYPAAAAVVPQLDWGLYGYDGSGLPLVSTWCHARGEDEFIDALDVLVRLSSWEHAHLAIAPCHAVYRPDPPGYELWTSAVALRALGQGDCEDFGADLVAQLRHASIDARAHLSEVAPGRYHVTALLPDGGEIDPAAIHLRTLGA